MGIKLTLPEKEYYLVNNTGTGRYVVIQQKPNIYDEQEIYTHLQGKVARISGGNKNPRRRTEHNMNLEVVKSVFVVMVYTILGNMFIHTISIIMLLLADSNAFYNPKTGSKSILIEEYVKSTKGIYTILVLADLFISFTAIFTIGTMW